MCHIFSTPTLNDDFLEIRCCAKTDRYGFERPNDFDYGAYIEFMSRYAPIVAKQSKRWSDARERDRLKNKYALKRLVRGGIPSYERTNAWLLLSGAQAARDESKTSYKDFKEMVTNRPIAEVINEIKKDLLRTYSDNVYFKKESALINQLYNVLTTFGHQNYTVGYCQGLAYIAGLLLLVTKDEETTFWLFKTLIERILPDYYTQSMSGLVTDNRAFEDILKMHDQAVHRHVTQMGFLWENITTKWFLCLYAGVLPVETVLRIWDCLFLEGSTIIFRVAFALIKQQRQQILAAFNFGELIACFRSIETSPYTMDCHRFMTDVFKTPGWFSGHNLDRVRKKHAVT